VVVAVAVAVMAGACSGTDPVGYDFQKGDGEGELGIWVHSGLYNREYVLHTPPGMAPSDAPRPLVIFLHGAGDTGASFKRRMNTDAATDALGFVTVWPDGMEGTWTVGCSDDCTFAQALRADDVPFLATLVRHLAESLPVDTTRVYLLGYSQGGQLAQLYGCESDLPPAGIGVVAAEMYKAAAARCAPRRPFPVGILHGTADPIAFFGGFGPGSVVLSVPETVGVWLDHFGCGQVPSNEFRADVAGDNTTVNVFRFPECGVGSSVTLFQVNGGGHTWPGDTGPWPLLLGARSRNLDATAEFLKLFGLLDPSHGPG
jgi:polyhydroxybutyrate depolymerase